ncbi:MAG: potassium transporter KtrB [Clostridia bacterium]|nr:potassium transporter KtrB [Clostridia bacterium]
MKKLKLSTTHIIMLSFLVLIMLGAVLLMLPISSANGTTTPFVDALFTATTATCVTGLVVVPTFSAWSTFGHVVILLLIQVGGLGVITVLAAFSMMLHRKMGLSDRLLVQDAFNLDSLAGLGVFVKKVVKGALVVEGVGALLYMTVFVPDFGVRGIWISVFNSISAFCNAGIDIFASDSLCSYATNPVINLVTSFLIVVGGLGFIVWWDVIRIIKGRISGRRIGLKSLTLHSKIVLSTTAVLLVGGGLLFLLLEYNNPLTIKDMSLYDKVQVAFFQSVTTRTAGFMSVPQENLTNASAILSLMLMFVGGSPVGTAGGVKTVTIVVIIASAVASVKNKDSVDLFNRSIARQTVSKAIAVACMSGLIVAVSTVLLSLATPHASVIDVAFETVSATATVGLSRNLTSGLDVLGKLIIIATMYFGRIGPISLAVALNLRKQNTSIIKNPTEDIRVG